MTNQPRCSRCGEFIPRPITENAYYVKHKDFAEVEEVPYFVGQAHTQSSSNKCNALANSLGIDFEEASALAASPMSGEAVENADKKINIPSNSIFEEVRVPGPAVVKEENNIVRVEERVEEQEVIKTGLVCTDDHKPDEDTVLWGPE